MLLSKWPREMCLDFLLPCHYNALEHSGCRLQIDVGYTFVMVKSYWWILREDLLWA